MAGSSIDEQSRYYDELWAHVTSTELNSHEQARLSTVRSAIERHLGDSARGLDILDVGCGRGWLSGLVLARYGRVTGYDLSPQAVEKARSTFPESTFEVRDVVTNPPPTGQDLVVSSEVIEHIEDQPRFVDGLVDALEPGGLLVVTTPNGLLESWWREHGPGFKPQPIERWLTPPQLRSLLARRCEVLEWGTFFFDVGRPGALYRLVNGRVGARARRHVGPRNPVDALASRRMLGLYQFAVARRGR